MPSKTSIIAVFLFAYFLCEMPANAALQSWTIFCEVKEEDGYRDTDPYDAYFETTPKATLFEPDEIVNITECDPATNTNCVLPTGRQIKCTINGWETIATYTRTCGSDSFLNKDDFKCYKCSSVTGNNNAIVNKTNPTNTAKDCYIPSNNQLENDRGFFNYDTSCYYASTGLNNATGFTPWWESV